ncbi:MAG: hypothetical protein ACYSUX_02125 [Planctomycetota bacterium]
MKEMKTNNKCRRIRGWLYTAISRSFGPEAQWLHNHIMRCPRCQRRLVSCGRVNLALSYIKSQPHGLDLLMRANTQAIAVLKHSLSSEPKARDLEKKLPEPKLLERCRKYGNSVANLAACIVILLLMKIGVFSSMDKFHNQGQQVMKQYYARQVGQDLADEVFAKGAKPPSTANSRGFANT